MKTNEIFKLIDQEDFLEKIYGFAYRRCDASCDAEDLCSDIIIAVISAIHKQDKIKDFYAFVWTIARRVYADFCDKRSKTRNSVSIENCELPLCSKANEIDEFIEQITEREQLKKIFGEITFLSKTYRDVMVMYYLEERKIKDIAQTLDISETTVKQRLFSARNIVRKEVESMNNRNLSLKPIRLAISGTGNPCGNDPRIKTERMLSQNLIYLCKDKPKTAKELSEELCIPMPYIEEELEIQCKGQNGSYGMLRKLNNGKYVINVHVVDYAEYDKANKICEQYLPEICRMLRESIAEHKQKILNFPYLSLQTDTRFILWSLITRTFGKLESDIIEIIKEKYFSDVVISDRPFSSAAIAYSSQTEEEHLLFDFYGYDGINATAVGGYNYVSVSNIYGKRIDKRFGCGHNLAQDPKLIMTLKSIGGLRIEELSIDEKETASKAIECGYIRKNGDMLEPQIIVIDKKNEKEFFSISNRLQSNMQDVKEKISKELSEFMKKHIPEHLMCEYPIYILLIAGIRMLPSAIEECIKEGLLCVPENRMGAEGMLMEVESQSS